jgi:hypothetical protein
VLISVICFDQITKYLDRYAPIGNLPNGYGLATWSACLLIGAIAFSQITKCLNPYVAMGPLWNGHGLIA